MAIIIAIMNNSKDREIKIKSDSKTSIEGIIYRIKAWEDKDWLDIANQEEWKYLAYLLRKRRAKTKFKWVKAHDGEEGNEKADQKANEGANKDEKTKIDLTINKKFEIRGARLQTLTQAQAYRLILRKKHAQPGSQSSTTSDNLEDIQDEIERVTGTRPSKEKIWKSLTNKSMENKMTDFLWKMIHNRLKCGKFFRYIENLKDREFCTCGETETPEHILLHCKESEVENFWKEIEKIWKMTTKINWIHPTKGIMTGIGTIIFTNEEGQKLIQITERYKTMVTQGIWIIWKARNRKIFDNIQTNSENLMKTWKEIIARRIQIEHTQIDLMEFKQREQKYKNFTAKWCENEILAKLTDKNMLRINII